MIPGPTVPIFLAVLLAACGMAGAATMQGSAPLAQGPVRCALHLTAAGRLISLQARATSPQDATAHYGLSVTSRDGSLVIDQAGPALLRAGQEIVLAEIAFTGRAESLAPDLTLTVAGQSQACPLVTSP